MGRRALRPIAIVLALFSGFACYPFFETDCAKNDPYCRPDVGWLLCQQLLDPGIPLFQAVGGQGVVARSFDGDRWTKNVPENSVTTLALFGGGASDSSATGWRRERRAALWFRPIPKPGGWQPAAA